MPQNLKRWDEPGHVHFWTLSCYRRLSLLLARCGQAGRARWPPAAPARIRHLSRRLCRHARARTHLALAARTRRGHADPRLLHSFKRHVAYCGKAALRDLWREHRRLWSEALNQWAFGTDHRLWHKRGYDFNVTRMETLLQKLDYCHKNPVARGLVDRPEQYRWSSHRYYELQDRSALGMDWDGQWPIVW